jgi:hypothetical protein
MLAVCTTRDTAHIDAIFSSDEYRCTHIDECVARTWISYRCVPCHPWCTHRTPLVVKKSGRFFGFLVIILVITGNITKRPVFLLCETIIMFRIMLSYPIGKFHRHGWQVMSVSLIPCQSDWIFFSQRRPFKSRPKYKQAKDMKPMYGTDGGPDKYLSAHCHASL